jgi:hypothetical protein
MQQSVNSHGSVLGNRGDTSAFSVGVLFVCRAHSPALVQTDQSGWLFYCLARRICVDYYLKGYIYTNIIERMFRQKSERKSAVSAFIKELVS